MLANCLLLPSISLSSEESLHSSQGCTTFPLFLPWARPPWNTVGVSSHSFQWVRTGLRSEETVNGHLEVGENICLWRYGGLVLPKRDSASHASLCVLICSYNSAFFFCIFFFSKYVSRTVNKYIDIHTFPRPVVLLPFPFIFPSLPCFSHHVTANRTWSSVPSCSGCEDSGWTPSLVSMTYESAAWVQCHLRISWTGVHISITPCSAGQAAFLLLLNQRLI